MSNVPATTKKRTLDSYRFIFFTFFTEGLFAFLLRVLSVSLCSVRLWHIYQLSWAFDFTTCGRTSGLHSTFYDLYSGRIKWSNFLRLLLSLILYESIADQISNLHYGSYWPIVAVLRIIQDSKYRLLPLLLISVQYILLLSRKNYY